MAGSEASRDPLSGRDANWMVTSSAVAPRSRLVIVERDHSPNGSAAALFKESRRREANIGTKTVFTLKKQVETGHPTVGFGIETYTPGAS